MCNAVLYIVYVNIVLGCRLSYYDIYEIRYKKIMTGNLN